MANQITQFPPPPTQDDPENFPNRADAFVAQFPVFVNEANALAEEVEANKFAAEAASNAQRWVAGTNYLSGDVVYSPTSYLSYRDKTGGVSNLDPANDPNRWVSLSGTDSVLDVVQPQLDDHESRITTLENEPGLSTADEGAQIETDTKSYNFTGTGVQASVTTPGAVQVNVPGVRVSDEGTLRTAALREINFVGEGVDAVDNGAGLVTVTIPGGAGGGGNVISVKDEGTEITPSLVSLDFVGAEVTAVDDGNGNVTVSVQSIDNTFSISEEGLAVLTDPTDINFVGDAVTVTDDGDGSLTVTVVDNTFSVSDEGIAILTDPTDINFVGDNVTVTDDGDGSLTVTVVDNTFSVQDEGLLVQTDPNAVNFVGDGVDVTSDGAGGVIVTIPGGAGGGGSVAVDDEGIEITPAATRLNFRGDRVVATDAGNGIVNIDIDLNVVAPPYNGGAGAVTADSSIYMFRIGDATTTATDQTTLQNAYGTTASAWPNGFNFSQFYIEKYSLEPTGAPVLEATYSEQLAADGYSQHIIPSFNGFSNSSFASSPTFSMCFNNGFLYVAVLKSNASENGVIPQTKLKTYKFAQNSLVAPVWTSEVTLGLSDDRGGAITGTSPLLYIYDTGFVIEECQADINGFYVHIVNNTTANGTPDRTSEIRKINLANGSTDFVIAGAGSQDLIDFAINVNNPTTGGIFTAGFVRTGNQNQDIIVKGYNSVTGGLVWERLLNAEVDVVDPLIAAIPTVVKNATTPLYFADQINSANATINISVNQETGNPTVYKSISESQSSLGFLAPRLLATNSAPNNAFLMKLTLDQNTGVDVGTKDFYVTDFGAQFQVFPVDSITYGAMDQYFTLFLSTQDAANTLTTGWSNLEHPRIFYKNPTETAVTTTPGTDNGTDFTITGIMSQDYDDALWIQNNEQIIKLSKFTGQTAFTKLLPPLVTGRAASYPVSGQETGDLMLGGFCIGEDNTPPA